MLTYPKVVYLPILPFHTFEVSVALTLYIFTFMLTDLIVEFYGKKRTNFCVKLAVFMNAIGILIVTGMDQLQATPWSKIDNTIFHSVFGISGLAFITGMFSTYVAQLVDVTLYLWIKKITKGKWLWLRNNGSTAISLWVDSFVCISLLAMLGVIDKERKWAVIMNSYSFKLFCIICNTPLFYLLVGIIRKFILPKKLPETELQLNEAKGF